MKNKEYKQILKQTKHINFSGFKKKEVTPATEVHMNSQENTQTTTGNQGAFALSKPKEDDTVRITMLGVSSVGKTAFLSGIYQTLISDPSTSLYLRVNDEANDGKDFLSIQDIAMVDNDKVNDFAAGTTETKAYKLILTGLGKTYCEFEFWDYRGHIVNDITPGKANTAETIAFRDQLIGSDVILMFADGVRISQYEDKAERKIKCQANLMNSIFTNILKQEPYHVILVLTKVDDEYVKAEDKADNYKKLCDKAMEIYQPIRDLSKSFAVIPVSAVGENRVNTSMEVVRDTGEKIWKAKLKSNTTPKPFNIELVILYACRRILRDRIKKWQMEDEELNIRILQLDEELERTFKYLPKYTKLRDERVTLSIRQSMLQQDIDSANQDIGNINDRFEDEFETYVKYVRE